MPGVPVAHDCVCDLRVRLDPTEKLGSLLSRANPSKGGDAKLPVYAGSLPMTAELPNEREQVVQRARLFLVYAGTPTTLVRSLFYSAHVTPLETHAARACNAPADVSRAVKCKTQRLALGSAVAD